MQKKSGVDMAILCCVLFKKIVYWQVKRKKRKHHKYVQTVPVIENKLWWNGKTLKHNIWLKIIHKYYGENEKCNCWISYAHLELDMSNTLKKNRTQSHLPVHTSVLQRNNWGDQNFKSIISVAEQFRAFLVTFYFSQCLKHCQWVTCRDFKQASSGDSLHSACGLITTWLGSFQYVVPEPVVPSKFKCHKCHVELTMNPDGPFCFYPKENYCARDCLQ